MTATVVDLTSRIRNRPRACGCPRHALEALTARALSGLAGTEGELLVDRQLVADLVSDLVSTVETALTTNARTNPCGAASFPKWRRARPRAHQACNIGEAQRRKQAPTDAVVLLRTDSR